MIFPVLLVGVFLVLLLLVLLLVILLVLLSCSPFLLSLLLSFLSSFLPSFLVTLLGNPSCSPPLQRCPAPTALNRLPCHTRQNYNSADLSKSFKSAYNDNWEDVLEADRTFNPVGHCLCLALCGLSLPFHCPSTAFALTYQCFSLTFHCLCLVHCPYPALPCLPLRLP